MTLKSPTRPVSIPHSNDNLTKVSTPSLHTANVSSATMGNITGDSHHHNLLNLSVDAISAKSHSSQVCTFSIILFIEWMDKVALLHNCFRMYAALKVITYTMLLAHVAMFCFNCSFIYYLDVVS